MGCSIFHFTFMGFFFNSSTPVLSSFILLLIQTLCHDHEISALLQLKENLIVNKSASLSPLAYPKVASWKSRASYSDSCLCDGVECDANTGHVISLDLSSSCLYGSLNSNSSLFRLVHLQRLNLATITSTTLKSHPKKSSVSNFIEAITLQLLRLHPILDWESHLTLNSSPLEQSIDRRSAKVIGQLQNARDLVLSSNQVKDMFPSWLGNLLNLKILSLRGDKFHGPIQANKLAYKFPSLQIIDLSQNNFVGKLPLELLGNRKALRSAYLTYFNVTSESSDGYDWHYIYNYSMTLTNKGINIIYERVQESFAAIDLSSNGFVGRIPESIRNFEGLHLLNLSNNIVTGQIPPFLGKLTKLEALDLSHNKLFGKIPQELTNLTFLGVFNVSHNHFMGPIPQGK
ncbi:Receptor-like protein 12 [Morella rubra]|uniref:Receptor-like protein 12 n=1 Tax=Morella rubra TaxID=262757 RepID=A0A6A1WIP4_9ROSI|nr:Receptor-like protein 12 [Morella rubra]